MPITNTKEMLIKAQNSGYAVAAFNVENMEMVQAVCDAAVSLNAPVIIATSASALKYAPPALFSAMVYAVAKDVPVPVALHLDHGSSLELSKACISASYTSVMIDGSQLPYEENVALTRSVVEICANNGISVEAELGHVGGKEDDVESEIMLGTDPDQAVDFVRKTGVDSLAVAIGTAHGIYKGVPKLDFSLLRHISESLEVPLVLHGASGLSNEALKTCIFEGICKVNFATELRLAYTKMVHRTLAEDPDAIDPKIYGRAARLSVRNVALEKIKLLGCVNKA
ncbi:MAG: class II fructose-bisphosphate aldolase [Christensenellales bacterium]